MTVWNWNFNNFFENRRKKFGSCYEIITFTVILYI